jgi:hypothetical protein
MSDPLHPFPPPDRRVKIPHLVFGLLFLGLATIWVLGASGTLRDEELTILGPAVLVAAGVIGLVASLAGARNRSRAELDTTADSTPDDLRHDDLRHDDLSHHDTQELR